MSWRNNFRVSNIYYDNTDGLILQGNSLDILRKFPNNFIDEMVCSPPYYNLRVYDVEPQIFGGDKNCEHIWEKYTKKGISGGKEGPHAEKLKIKGVDSYMEVPDTDYFICKKCNAYLGHLGQEPTPELYMKNLMAIFVEIKRVLRSTGTCFVNIADSYEREGRSLIGIPEVFTIEMRKIGFIRRNTLIWFKKNCMPSSAATRFTIDFEYLYFFTKEDKYYFEQQFEPYSTSYLTTLDYKRNSDKDKYAGLSCDRQFEAMQKVKEGIKIKGNDGQQLFEDEEAVPMFPEVGGKKHSDAKVNPVYSGEKTSVASGRNMRCVWEINPEPSNLPHFAQYPSELVRRCILAGCPKFICKKCGKIREKQYRYIFNAYLL